MAAYRLALNERVGYLCDAALILVAQENAPPQAIFIDTDQLDLYESRFLKRAALFHHLNPEEEDIYETQDQRQQTVPQQAN